MSRSCCATLQANDVEECEVGMFIVRQKKKVIPRAFWFQLKNAMDEECATTL
ncbi:hypothetical protein GJ744_003717 [Endocarpon pusillum]|uniref:Uncharacterized protein n=1 Tax=Endocarpon pusillum TaxID=364733 RepID=A0A8H7E0E9_9EURO|nr:hypothetical protein GJ744_003717 [Endocarpon pusillum]